MKFTHSDTADEAPAFLAGGGSAGALARSVDWANTPLGPIADWPQSLKAMVGVVLHSRHPMFLWWGPELVQFYNDGYLPSFGTGKHPAAMGQRGRDCWQEIWPIIWPQIDDVMSRAKPSWNQDQLVPILRNGRLEEVYWSYGYSPVFDDDGTVGGTLVVCTETTSRVIAERRQHTLRQLMESTAQADSSSSLMQRAADVLSQADADIAFSLIYTGMGHAGDASLQASVGLADAALTALDSAVRGQVVAEQAAADPVCFVCAVEASDAAGKAPGGRWPEPAQEMLIAPLVASSASVASGFIVYGLSPRLQLDQAYRDFLSQVTEHLALAHTRIESLRLRAAAEHERRNLLLQAPVATALLTGPDHMFELANPLYCELTGRHDVVGKTYREAFPELARTELPSLLDRVYATGEPFVTEEYPAVLDRRRDGTLEACVFRFNLQPMRNIAGSVYGMMAVAVDITDQVRARRVLEKSQAEREKLLTELEAANRAKDEFLAMLGHELRNPLAPIVTALQLMKLRADSRTTKEQGVIERQVTHLVRLVDDLLDVSRITRGKVDLQKEPLEIGDVLVKAVEMASVLFEKAEHELSIDVPRHGLAVSADPVRLAQVVSNLLTNAARYTDRGGKVRLAAFRDGSEIVISVSDNGVGISAEMLPQLFDLFVQGKRSADRSEGGLGIGLTLVKNLVLLHGGSVSAKSEGLGMGSEFVVRLPAADAPAPSTHAAHARETTGIVRTLAGVRRRVLVVDDNADAADLLAELLRSCGHEVAVVNDPMGALAAARDFKPEVAVLDIGLPVMDGYELAARLRESDQSAACRLIALTGYGQDHDRLRSQAAGFESHLVKPVDTEMLVRIVARDHAS